MTRERDMSRWSVEGFAGIDLTAQLCCCGVSRESRRQGRVVVRSKCTRSSGIESKDVNKGIFG